MKITIFVAILLCHRATSAPQGIVFGNENVQKVIFGDNLPKKEVEITEEQAVFISTEEIYNQALQTCATNSSTPFDVPYYDRKQKGYVCHTLLSKGPCIHHENWWLVLDKKSTRAKCEPKKCVQEEIHYDFIPFENSEDCVDPADLDSVEKICGVNQKLGLNPFGEGECVCAEGFLDLGPLAFGNKNSKCQLEYCQGLCEEGFHHEIEETDGGIQTPVCLLNSKNSEEKCKSVGVRQLISGGDLDTVCPDGQHRDETDGRCVKTWQRGLGNQIDILAYLKWRQTQNGK
jgi:hypothetical protein